jgi:hypothetical protein
MTAEGAIVGDLEGPGTAVFRQERIGHPLQEQQVPHDDGLAVQHHVEALIPGIAPGGHRAVPVGGQVSRLLLTRPAGEIQRAVHPDRDDRGDMRTAIGPDGGYPKQPGGLQAGQCVGPRCRLGGFLAVAGVEGGPRELVRHGFPFFDQPQGKTASVGKIHPT